MLGKSFNDHPIVSPQWNTYTSFRYVVGVMHDVSGQPEVTDLHHVVLGEQDVPSR